MHYFQPYLFLLISLLLIASVEMSIKFDKKSLTIMNIIVIILLLLFFGLRGFVGWDWYNYYPYFTNIPTLDKLVLDKVNFEPGFSIYTSFIKTIFPNYNFFIFTSSIIDLILLDKILKRYIPQNFHVFALAVFFSMEGMVMEINLMRNIKAILLFIISIQYIEKRKFSKFLLLNLIGISFHWSSIFFIPLYFFVQRKLNIKTIILIFIIGNIIYLFQINYITSTIESIAHLIGGKMQTRTDSYLVSTVFSRQYGITLGYLEKIGTTFLVLLYYSKLTQNSKVNIIFINCYLIFLCIVLYFSELSIIITRVGSLFIFSYWILWPQIIKYSTSTSKFLLFVFFSLYLSIRTITSSDNVMFKYDSILQNQTMSYKERTLIFNKNSQSLQKKNN